MFLTPLMTYTAILRLASLLCAVTRSGKITHDAKISTLAPPRPARFFHPSQNNPRSTAPYCSLRCKHMLWQQKNRQQKVPAPSTFNRAPMPALSTTAEAQAL